MLLASAERSRYTAFSYLLGLYFEASCEALNVEKGLNLLQRFEEAEWHSTM